MAKHSILNYVEFFRYENYELNELMNDLLVHTT
jgi:hypothetical protein